MTFMLGQPGVLYVKENLHCQTKATYYTEKFRILRMFFSIEFVNTD